jgi:AcrR family transcriptional regulator
VAGRVEAEPTLTPAGHRLLDAASDLFYNRGIRAVGVDLIAETAGTTKKTLYDRFGSKDALVALYLQRRAGRWQEFLGARLEEVGPEVSDQVAAVFDALQAWHDFGERGCAFVNAYAELGGHDHPGLDVIRVEKRWMHDLFQGLAADAGGADPEYVGNLLHLVYEGALVQATAGGLPDAIGRAREAAVTIIRS